MKRLVLAGAAMAALLAGAAQAAPTALTQAAFLNTDTVIDFNAVGNEAFVGSTYSGSGAIFSGALYGMTNGGDTQLFPGNGGGVIASNWLYSHGSNQGLSYTANLSSLVTRVGFWLENWPNQTASVELFNGATS